MAPLRSPRVGQRGRGDDPPLGEHVGIGRAVPELAPQLRDLLRLVQRPLAVHQHGQVLRRVAQGPERLQVAGGVAPPTAPVGGQAGELPHCGHAGCLVGDRLDGPERILVAAPFVGAVGGLGPLDETLPVRAVAVSAALRMSAATSAGRGWRAERPAMASRALVDVPVGMAPRPRLLLRARALVPRPAIRPGPRRRVARPLVWWGSWSGGVRGRRRSWRRCAPWRRLGARPSERPPVRRVGPRCPTCGPGPAAGAPRRPMAGR